MLKPYVATNLHKQQIVFDGCVSVISLLEKNEFAEKNPPPQKKKGKIRG